MAGGWYQIAYQMCHLETGDQMTKNLDMVIFLQAFR